MSQSVHFCFYIDSEYGDFVSHIRALRLYRTVERELVRKVLVSKDESMDDRDGYWGYWDNEDAEFVHIYKGKVAVQLCSADFFERHIKEGRGFISGLKIDVLEITEEDWALLYPNK